MSNYEIGSVIIAFNEYHTEEQAKIFKLNTIITRNSTEFERETV